MGSKLQIPILGKAHKPVRPRYHITPTIKPLAWPLYLHEVAIKILSHHRSTTRRHIRCKLISEP